MTYLKLLSVKTPIHRAGPKVQIFFLKKIDIRATIREHMNMIVVIN